MLATSRRELFGRGWKSSIQIWLWVQLVFAPIAILAGPVAGLSDSSLVVYPDTPNI